jgi:hypothetical protein
MPGVTFTLRFYPTGIGVVNPNAAAVDVTISIRDKTAQRCIHAASTCRRMGTFSTTTSFRCSGSRRTLDQERRRGTRAPPAGEDAGVPRCSGR